jgi:hypothetical protein
MELTSAFAVALARCRPCRRKAMEREREKKKE